MAFDSYYQNLFAGEWNLLRSALLQPRRHVARLTHAGKQLSSKIKLLGVAPLPGTQDCYPADSAEIQLLLTEHPEAFYLMDMGSVLAVTQLAQLEWSSCWDMCAAPGGKSLILLEQLEEASSIQLTDLSRPRLEKLKQVIRTYHNLEILGMCNVRFTSTDAVNWGYRHQGFYDAVLLDAPCSSERHVIADAAALDQWSPNRVKSLSKRQYALLCSAVLSCREGGHVLYSTCSINAQENDEVIARYLKKKKDVRVCDLDVPLGMSTEHGWMIRPDLHEGWGPLYFTLLEVL